MAFVALASTEVDAKSPLDDALFEKIKDNFDDLNSRVITAGNSPFVWELSGPLREIAYLKRSVGFGLINKEFTPSVCRFMLKKSGTSGSLAFDIRKHTRVNVAITGIDHQYSAATQSIARITGAATQSVTRAASQISTQSITFAKAAINVESIIQVPGTTLWRYNLASAPDSDWVVGDVVTFSSCTNAANDGNFALVEISQSGHPSVVVSNGSGVAQTGAAGSCQIRILSYNFTNPVASEFAAGEIATFASHTSGTNDGALTIYAVNQSGNNIWVKRTSSDGAVQAGVAGTVDTNQWKYTYSAAVSTTNFVVGEKAYFSGHTNSNNDGAYLIKAVNSGGNNIIAYNSAGVTQGGVAGNGDTNRWKYALPSDPSSQISAGDTVYLSGHTDSDENDGTFTVKEVNNSAGNNVVIYNTAGVAQGGAVGNTYTTRKLVKFAADQSANFTTDSYIEMTGCPSGLYNFTEGRAPFRVLQVNRGGGANYNVVIDNPTAPSQASPAGMVAVEMKSIFNTAPSLASSVVGLTANENIVGTSTDLISTAITAQTPLMVYLTEIPSGAPEDLTVLVA